MNWLLFAKERMRPLKGVRNYDGFETLADSRSALDSTSDGCLLTLNASHDEVYQID
jgi:hypothetical protein